MKKLILSLAVIVTAMLTVNTVMARDNNPIAPACVSEKYPDLYTGAGEFGYEKGPNGEKIITIYQTLPFKNVTETNAGYYFAVVHPILYNECTDTTDYVPDSDMEGLKQAFNALKSVDKKEAAAVIEKMDVTITLRFVNGKTDGIWRLNGGGISYPNTFSEAMKKFAYKN